MKKFNFKGFGKRQVTLLSLVILIAVAGYINITHKDEDAIPVSGEIDLQQEAPPLSASQGDEYFALSRHEKEKSRSAAMEVYREVSKDSSNTAAVKEDAQKELTASAKAIETEALLEGLIKAKGFEDAIVYISEGAANIVVKTMGLTPGQAAQIKELVMENAKIAADKIKIVEIK
ncbi:MAG: SpoIIIAH-like family protein [Firmicutes bacterium]|nr:SpoIIIAH-like family protein [Bacillota bacterium]